jgi:hypothetical protein
MRLRQDREELAGLAILFLIGAVEADDDVVDEAGAGEFLDDVGERRTFQLGKERRQDQRDLAVRGEDLEFAFQRTGFGGPQIVQRGHVTVLVKIRHAPPAPICPVFFNNPQHGFVPTLRPRFLRPQDPAGLFAVEFGQGRHADWRQSHRYRPFPAFRCRWARRPARSCAAIRRRRRSAPRSRACGSALVAP